MQLAGLALASAVLFLIACGGSEGNGAAQAATDSTTSIVQSPAVAGGSVAASPITGTIHEVKMLGDAQGYRFDPATIVAKPGDGIKFIMTTGGPHNVSFDAATIPADQKDQLFANMPNQADGGSPMLMNPNETWTLSLGNLKPGKYPFHCTPHFAMNMKGEISVE